MTEPQLAKLERVDLRTAWKSEPADFTPWLAKEENLALLGETLGMTLVLEEQEKDVGPFRADILCKEPQTDQWVLIENQLERTDHTHLGQIITYAAGLNAVTVVWIAASFTEEHRAALDWLNEITGEGADFFGVQVELYRIGDSPAAPHFTFASKPNAWSKRVLRRDGEGRQWDEESFFAELEKRAPAGVVPARRLLDWTKQNMPDIYWGRGARSGSFFPGLQLGSIWQGAFAVWTYGRLELQFQWMRKRPVFDDDEKRLDLLRRLNDEADLGIPEDGVDFRPAVDLDIFADHPSRLEALLNVFDWYVGELKAFHARS